MSEMNTDKRACNDAVLPPGMVRPLYGANCFTEVPRLVEAILSPAASPTTLQTALGSIAEDVDRVIVLLVDAFGWKFFERFRTSLPVLRRFEQQGLALKLTAGFPPTTAAAVTTMHTGVPAGEHGVYEWFYYEPKVDAVISPFLFCYAGEPARSLSSLVQPDELFPAGAVYQRLRQAGVSCTMFHPASFCGSPYDQALLKEAALRPYRYLSTGLTLLAEHTAHAPGKSYAYFYYGSIDSVCHEYGPESHYADAEIRLFWTALEKLLLEPLRRKKPEKTLLLATADHGSIAVSPSTTVYINREFPEILRNLRQSRSGAPLAPAGSPRDLFLHVLPDAASETASFLSKALAGAAHVRLTAELIQAGLFGPPPVSAAFLSRVGELLILAAGNNSVWWHEEKKFEQKHRGHHGSLTPDEMEVPLLAMRL